MKKKCEKFKNIWPQLVMASQLPTHTKNDGIKISILLFDPSHDCVDHYVTERKRCPAECSCVYEDGNFRTECTEWTFQTLLTIAGITRIL